jgi:hypothetical protein
MTQKRFLYAESVVKIVVALHAAGYARMDVKPQHIVQVANEADTTNLSVSASIMLCRWMPDQEVGDCASFRQRNANPSARIARAP